MDVLSWSMVLYILEGIGVTLKYSVISVFFGLAIGIICATIKVSNYKFLRYIADIYTSIFRGTPLLIQLSIVYYGLPSLVNIKIDMFAAGVLAFSLNSGAYVSEIIRAGINAVDKGQSEAAKALGIPPMLIMRDIILPQAIRNILPSLINELINMIKESAIISVIGEMDLMRRAQLVATQTYDYFSPMLIAASIYYLLILVITQILKVVEKRLSPNTRHA